MLEPSPLDGGWRCTASPAKNTRPLAMGERVHVVDGPDARWTRSLIGIVSSPIEIVGDRVAIVVGNCRRRLIDVVAPDDQPLVPRAHHAHEAHADAADVRARLHNPVKHARAMRDILRKVGLEHDVHRAGDTHLALPSASRYPAATLTRPPSAPITYLARISMRRPAT